MASAVEICNLALMKFGNITISSITAPTTKEERACAVFYPLMRDELIASHPWNFAMTRADISASVATAPAFGFDYAYTLPVNCLRVWECTNYDGTWVVESRELLTDAEEEIYIRYLRQVTETGYFPPAFVNCLATRLAAELAVKLADDKSLRQALLQELYQVSLPEAKILNAMEGNAPRHKDIQPLDEGNFSWTKEGR